MGIEIYPSVEVFSNWQRKAKQVENFQGFLPDNSNFIRNLQELEKYESLYTDVPYELVTKEEYSWGGQGTKKFKDFTELCKHFHKNPLEIRDGIVVQKFIPVADDYKLLIMGDYNYVMQRFNPNGFVKNTTIGGRWENLTFDDLSPDVQAFCYEVLEHSGFPFIYLDILVAPERTYLLEVGLTSEHWSPKTKTTYNSISRDEFGRMCFEYLKNFYLPGTELEVHENIPWRGDIYDDSRK